MLGHELVAQDHELVAAEASDGVARAEGVAQPLRQCHQQAVAHAVAEAVVHDLEVVDIKNSTATGRLLRRRRASASSSRSSNSVRLGSPVNGSWVA